MITDSTTVEHVTRGGQVVKGRVFVLSEEEKLRLTVHARCAASQAAVRLLSVPGYDYDSPFELAEKIERWILRDSGEEVPWV